MVSVPADSALMDKIHLSPYEQPVGALLNSLPILPYLRALLPPYLYCKSGCLGLAGVMEENPSSLPKDVPLSRGSNEPFMNLPSEVHSSCHVLHIPHSA